MARKYGKNETTLSNVLKLVKALLALADGEIAVPGDKLKATFKVEWVKEDELLVSGKVQEKRNNRTQTVEKGITKEDLWTLVESSREVLELSQVKDEKNKPTEAERKSNAIQDILDCLKDLDILVEKLIDGKPTVKTQGFWKFSLKLKHQAKTEENLKFITEQWKIKNGSVTVETSHQTVISKDKPLNWQEICRQNLAQQKELTTNPFTNAYGVTPQLDKVYVRLAIVERKPPKPPSINQPEEKEEEKLIPITEDSFFEDVLRQGKSKISQGRKIAIIGEPGSGKTTRLQKIAYEILDKGLGLPIWISLADFTQPTITQYIEEIWLKQTGKSLTIEEFTQQKERIWLLLDGLDEMTSRVETRHVSALLGGWVQGLRVVVTCRVNVWEADKNAFSGFDVFRNLEFNPEQVTDYIRRWFAAMGDAATGESLEAELEQSENYRLKELIQNPLRLWMLCQIWRLRRGILPDTKAGLYELFVKYIYHWNKYEETIKIYAKLCGINQRQCKENLHKALGELAKAAFAQKSAFFRLSYQLVDKYLGDENEETSLFSLARSLGWLNRVGLDINEPEKSTYMFYHATFQEYFAALAVDDWDYFLPRNHVNFPVPGKHYRIFEPQWKQVILLWLGHGDVADEDKEKFIQKLITFQDGCRGAFYTDQSYFLAALAVREFKKSLQANKIVNQIVKWGFGYFDNNNQAWQNFLPSLEQDARKILVKTDRILATKELLSLMSQPQLPEHQKQTMQLTIEQLSYCNKKVNFAASENIENNLSNDIIIPHWKDLPSDVLELAAFIDAHKNDEIVSIAILKLESISRNNFQSILVLLKLIKTSIAQNNRWVAVSILLKIFKSNRSVSLILANLLILLEKNQQVNLECINLENTIDSFTQAATEMIKIFMNTEDEQIRILSAVVLSEIGKGNMEVIAELIERIKFLPNHKLGELIIIVLGDIGQGNSQVIQVLSEIIEFSVDKYIRWRSAESLGKINLGNIQSIATLVEIFITTEDQIIQRETPMILEKLSITDQQRAIIVSGLSPDNRNFKVNKNYLHLWLKNYTFLWNIAQEFPYPDFYHAWHGLTEI